MEYQISDIIDKSTIQKILDEYCYANSIPVSLCSITGEKLISSGNDKIFADFISTYSEASKVFSINSEMIDDILDKDENINIIKSDAGLLWVILPVKIDEEIISYLSAGCFLTDESEKVNINKHLIKSQNQQIDLENYNKLINHVPVISEEILQITTAFLSQTATMISAFAKSKYEEQKLRKQLESNNLEYRDLFNNFKIAISLHEIIVDETNKPVDFIFLEVNNYYEELLGIKAIDIVGKRALDVFPNIAQEWIQSFGEVALTGKSAVLTGYVDIFGKHLEAKVYSPGKNQFSVAITDTTDKINIIKDLTEKEKTLRVVAENYPNSFLAILDRNYNVIFASGQEFKNRNINPDDYIGLNIRDIYTNEYETVKSHYDKTFNGNEQVFILETEGRSHEYRTVPLYNADGEIFQILLVAEDVRDRIEKQKEILELKEFNESIVSNLTEGVILENDDGIIQFANPAMEKMLGYSSGELKGKHWRILVPDDNIHKVTDANQRRKTGASDQYEMELLAKDGSKRNVMVGGVPNYQKSKYTGLLAAFTDITELKKAESKIRENEQLYRQIFEANQAIKLLVEIDTGNIVQANKAAEIFYGYSTDELCSMNIRELNELSKEEVNNKINEVQTADKSYFIFKHRLKSGEIRDVEVYTGPIQIENKSYLYSIVHDITERKKAEEELTRKQFFLSKAQEIAKIGTWQYNIVSNEFVWTDEMYGIFGATKDTKLSFDFLIESVHKDERAYVLAEWQKAIKGQPIDIMHRLDIDGKIKWVREIGIVEFDENGESIKTIGVTHDITDIRNNEEALRTSELKFRKITEQSTDMIALTDDQGIISYVSPQVEQIFGIKSEEMIGNHFVQYLDNSSIPIAIEAFERTIKNNIQLRNLELLMKRPDGKTIYGDLSGSFFELNGAMSTLVVIRDISERKFNEQRILQEMRRNQQYLDIAGVMILALDKDGRVTLVNEKGCELLSGKEEDIIGKNWFATFLPDTVKKQTKEVFDSLISANQDVYDYYEQPIVRLDGEKRLFAWHNSVVRDENGNVNGTLSSGEDITERYKAQQELLQSEERFKALHNASFGGIGIHDNGTILECNKGLSDITGYSYDELIGMDGLILVSKSSRDKVIANIVSGYEKPYEAIGIRKNGEEYFLRIEGKTIPYKDKNVRVVEFRDISGQKILEEQLRQAQKIESIGHLAGGIAHDFNNLLTPIIANSELAMMDMNPSEPLYADLQIVLDTASRASELTRQLLAFSRKQVLSMKAVDINKLIVNFRKILRRTIREDIEIEMDFENLGGRVNVDPSQIEQVLMNIFVNAQDAMPDGGRITLITSKVEFNQEYLNSHPGLSSPVNARITITDNGQGMEKVIADKIFDPFFTTKEVGKGTGLGLSTSYGIMKQHSGDILVESELGKGTTFTLYFPLHESEEMEADGININTKKYFGSETILIVEDQPQVKRVAAKILQLHNYDVHVAGSGEEAIQMIRDEKLDVDLLLTDIIMPKMNGRELYEHLKELVPDLKVLFMSGYTKDVISHHGIMDEDINFIQKPLSVENLSRKVKNVLKS